MNKMNEMLNGSSCKIIIRVLLVVFALNIAVFVFKLADRLSGREPYEYSEFAGAARDLDFPELSEMAARNRILEKKTNINTSQFEALSDYYEASVLYHAYQKDGQPEKAAEYLSVMQSIESALTDPDVIAAVEALR